MDDSTENDNDGLQCDQVCLFSPTRPRTSRRRLLTILPQLQHEPQVPSVILLDPSSAPDPPPTPESVSLAAQPTPTQEEVEEAWPAPSNDNMNAADTWGFGTVAAPDINPGDTWGSNNEATSADNAADTWGTEAKGENANTSWKDGGGWKSDRGESNDRGYGNGGFRRDRPFWQPPERDGGWEGFRKRGGYVSFVIVCWTLSLFHHVNMYSVALRAVVAAIQTPVGATMIMVPGSLRTTTRGTPPMSPIPQVSSPPGVVPTTR